MYEENVRRGMVWLDENFGPHWLDRVSLDSLYLSDCCLCVLGQICGDFDEAMTNYELDGDDVTAFGFNLGIPARDQHPQWQELTATWKAAILAERARRQVSVVNEALEVAPAQSQLATAN